MPKWIFRKTSTDQQGESLFKFLFLADQPPEEEEDGEDDLKMESAKSESETEKSETEKMEESTEENPDTDSNKATMEESSGESPEPESETGGKETMEEENGNSGNGISSISRENMDDNGDTEEKDSEETENTVRRLKPRTSSLTTTVLLYDSLPECPWCQNSPVPKHPRNFQPITIQVNSGQWCCNWLKYLWEVGISVTQACRQTVVRKYNSAQAKVGCL